MSLATASPSEQIDRPREGLRYSEITPELRAGLRILAALEACYPQTGDRATRTLEGLTEWRRKVSGSSRDHAQATGGAIP